MLPRIKAFWGVLRGSRSPGRIILAQLLVKTGLNRYLTIHMDGYKLRFSRSALAVALFANPDDRHNDEHVLRKILKIGDTFVDVGANIGTLALTASNAVSSVGKVIAIEAHPETHKILQANIELNKPGNITAIHSAVGEKEGALYFSNIASDDQNRVVLRETDGTKVMVHTLDELLRQQPIITILKIDVEGYEKFVLEGAQETLKRTGIVFYESWEDHFARYRYDTTAVTGLLRAAGFELFKFDHDELEQLPLNYKSVNCENLLALRDSQTFCRQFGFTIRR